MTATLLAILCATLTSDPVDTVVVCPAEFRQALAPWVAHREAQGHHLAMVSNLLDPRELRGEIRRLATPALRYLVLVGDAEPAGSTDERLRRRSVPTQHVRAVVNVRFGSEPELATDNWYADLDDDRVPELAVGRLPADSPAELATMVRKIIDYESCSDFGLWRRQVHFVAGLGGWGAVADAVLEAAAKSLITEGVPAPFATTMTYGSWQSPYCPDPRQFARTTLERLNEGSLFWIYIGHGEPRAVDRMYTPGGSYPILTSEDAAQLASRHGATIACFLACYSGAFDQPRDCLGEELLRRPGGPVAVLCGTRVMLPYALAVIGSELLHVAFVDRPETLGEALVAAKRRTMSPEANGNRAALNSVARAFYPAGADLEAERAEHLDLFTLLGDPLTRLPYPREIALACESAAVAGERITVRGDSPIGGTCRVELAVRRDRLTFQPPRRGRFDGRELAAYDPIYHRANDHCLACQERTISAGPFAFDLEVPREARGACHVRIFVEGDRSCGVGAADLRIEPPSP